MKNWRIQTEKLNKIYGNIHAVYNFTFKAEAGEIIALLGPNGAGKSTLMNMLTGYLSPSSGQIFINGRNITDYPLESKKEIGFLPEGAPIYSDMTVKMFLKYMAGLRDVSNAKVDEVIKTAHIENVMFQKIETLSKGYLRRVGFAQSILSDPKILLLDEPTDGLDPNQKEYMQKLIRNMGKDKTILISTHLLDEAEAIADRIVIMNKGCIMADGTLSAIEHQTKTTSLGAAFHKLTKGEGKANA